MVYCFINSLLDSLYKDLKDYILKNKIREDELL